MITQEEQSGSLNSLGSFRDPMQAVNLLDDVGAMSASSPNSLELQAMVKEKLTAIFQRHGAVERTDNPALFPYHSYYSADDVFRFLDTAGKVMQLPYGTLVRNHIPTSETPSKL